MRGWSIVGALIVVGSVTRPAAGQVPTCEQMLYALQTAPPGTYTPEQVQVITNAYNANCVAQQPAPPPPEPPSLTVNISNGTGLDLELTFKSGHRDAWWPGNGQVYNLNNGRSGTYRLNCIAGESICYGASWNFLIERYWGAGSTHNYSCKNCCYTCGPGAQTSFNLTP